MRPSRVGVAVARRAKDLENALALQVAASLSTHVLAVERSVAVELGNAEGAATTLRDGPPLTTRALEAVLLEEEEEGGTSSAGASAGGTQ